MCKQILLPIIIIALIITTSHSNLNAQYHLGIEAGATLSSLYTIQEPTIELFSGPVPGARAGLFFEAEIKDFIALKTGVFGVLKGANLHTGERWNVVYLTVPVLLNFTPIKPLKLGIGVELGALVADNYQALADNKLSLGIRAEVAWQISPSFRLIAHSTVDVTTTSSVFYTDDQGFLVTKNNYNHITGGLSLAYTIKTFDKKG
jgi:hypothetical protein